MAGTGHYKLMATAEVLAGTADGTFEISEWEVFKACN